MYFQALFILSQVPRPVLPRLVYSPLDYGRPRGLVAAEAVAEPTRFAQPGRVV